MSNLENALQQLRGEHKQAQLMVEKLGQAISVIQGLVGTAKSGNGVRQSRNISPAGRRRISLAQKARWARVKAQGTNAISIASRRGKLIMSASARRKIAAAQRARWAKVRAQQKKAA